MNVGNDLIVIVNSFYGFTLVNITDVTKPVMKLNYAT